MPVTLELSGLVAGALRSAAVIKNALLALQAKFDAGIVGADISPNAGIPGSAIAANTLPGDRVQAGTLTLTQMGAASVGTTQLVDLAVTKGKLSTTVGQRVTKAQTEVTVSSVAFALGASVANKIISANPTVVGANYAVSIFCWSDIGLPGIAFSVNTYSPATPVPTATNTVIACYVSGYNYLTGVGTINLVTIANS